MQILTLHALLTLMCFLSKPVLPREIPSFVHLCKIHQPDFQTCFNNTIFELIPYLANGIPQMNVPPIEPFAFSSATINFGTGAAVNFKAELSNGTIRGISKFAMPVNEIDMDVVRAHTVMEFPFTNTVAHYKVKGKVTMLEIDSEGYCEWNATDLVVEAEWYGHHYSDKGKEHTHIDRIDVKKVDVGSIVLRFQDFAEEKQTIVEAFNKALNENTEMLAGEVKNVVKEILAATTMDYFNRVYKLFSNDELFPED